MKLYFPAITLDLHTHDLVQAIPSEHLASIRDLLNTRYRRENPPPVEPLKRIEVYAIRAGDKIAAIKSYRARLTMPDGSGPGLKQAKDVIDAYDLNSPLPES